MTRTELIQWIKENDKLYVHVNISFLTDEELLKLKRFIDVAKQEEIKK